MEPAPLASDGVLLIDTVTTIVLVSEGALDLLGYAASELADQRFPSLVPALRRDQVTREIDAVLVRRNPEYCVALPLARRDRTSVAVQMRVIGVGTASDPLGALVTLNLLPSTRNVGRGPHAALTPRQRQVAHRLLDGVTVQDIASTLGISLNTARMHIKNMHSSSGTRTLHGLAIWALRHSDCCTEV